MDLQINLNIDTEMVDKEYEIMYNEFQSENERIAFLRIGQSLIIKEDMDENFTFDYIKTYEENKNEFITKLDAKINAFSNTRDNILKNIDMIMSENKLILDNIKLFESKINDETNKNIFIQFLQINQIKKKREYLQNQLDNEHEIYKLNFNKISEMHEELLKLNYCFKSTNHYKSFFE
jgi:TRAP-type C4-dicarboxylate transport system substrate-binding protein